MQLDLSDRIGAPPINWGDITAGQEPGKGSEWVRVSQRVLATCLWPHDKERRDHWHASWAASAMEHVMRMPPPPNWPADTLNRWPAARMAVRDAVEVFDLMPHGTQLSAQSITSPEFDLSKWEEIWMRLGTLLMTLRALDTHHRAELQKGPSLRKAYDLVESVTAWNRQQLEDAWKRYSSVSHLVVAAYMLVMVSRKSLDGGKLPPDHPALHPGFYFLRGLPLLLSVAREWQRWLLALRVHPGKPLITENQLWLIPATDGPPSEICMDVQPFDEKTLISLRDYRARTGKRPRAD